MTKLKAFLIHFFLSLSIFSAVSLLVIFIWYPGIYLETSGVWKALRMVALVDVGLGPLMTLILYRKNKPGLKFDLSVVAAFQVAALVYGVSVLHSEKPELMVFHDGMFVCLNQEHVDYAEVPLQQFDSSGDSVPVAILPALQGDIVQDWDQRSKALPEGYPVHPAYVYGKYFINYDSDSLSLVIADEWDLTRQIAISSLSQREWEAYQKKHGDDAGHAFFPLTCGLHQYMLAVDRENGGFEEVLDISFINAQRKRLMPSENR